jgi:hypothetical protein
MTVGQRWTLVGVIGSGGTACVFEAVHRNGSRVAVKILHADFRSHARIRRRFLAEGYAANLVRHDGAVKILDEGETEDGGAYLVMELLEGETLAARLLRDGPLPVDRVRAWAIAVLDILASAHEHHVVHRDVKPSNIFVTHRGQVKLLDFGIARISVDSSGDEQLTQQDVALGTPAFMAPEQAAGRTAEMGAATDVWGVGATMFQLLTGRPVHDPKSAGSSSEVYLAAPPVRAFAPNLSPELAKVVDRALSLRPSDRWPTARAMIRALELAAEPVVDTNAGEGETLTEKAVFVPKPAAIFHHRFAVAILVIGLTVAGALGALLLMRPLAKPGRVAEVAPAAVREPSLELVAARPLVVEAASAYMVQSTSSPSASSAIRQSRPQAGVPQLKASGDLSPPRTLNQPQSEQTQAVSDLDSLLDRRE